MTSKTQSVWWTAKCPLATTSTALLCARYAIHRFLVQGFRGCQGIRAGKMSLYGMRPTLWLFDSGLPLWKMEDGNFYANPWGHACGGFYWTEKVIGYGI